MIWLFKMDEVFWGAKPTVDEHYLFHTDDINFDITRYSISLYFATAYYFVLSESDDKSVYRLHYDGTDMNPPRWTLPIDSEYYTIIREFYMSNKRDNKLKEIGI